MNDINRHHFILKWCKLTIKPLYKPLRNDQLIVLKKNRKQSSELHNDIYTVTLKTD